jgi:hypothetical protein
VGTTKRDLVGPWGQTVASLAAPWSITGPCWAWG